MREIKFRGLSVHNKEFVYGSLIKKRFTVFAEWMIEDKNGLGSDVITETIGQYTGLKDKNDRDIYEGDIVLTNSNDIRVIKYFQNGFIMEPITTDNITWYFTVEVIGNIHENPELLNH